MSAKQRWQKRQETIEVTEESLALQRALLIRARKALNGGDVAKHFAAHDATVVVRDTANRKG